MSADTNQLRTRLYNVVPAASFQMEKLLGLLDVEFSDAVPSAAVECSRAPRLLLNPSFVERYCQRDGHLLMLVLHELQHVILGHTRLFSRVSWAHNLAFDAVINAMLCRQFPSEADFFRSFNSWEVFPARLLRPAPGWPEKPEPLPADARPAERELHALLYGDGHQQVTYHEVFALLVQELRRDDGDEAQQEGPQPNDGDAAQPDDPQQDGGEAVLLGDHEGVGGDGELDPAAVRDETFQSVMRRIVEGWPPPDQRLAGRDTGRDQPGWTLEASGSPRAALRGALRHLLARAGVLSGTARARRRRARVESSTGVNSVIPQARDRRAHAWTRLHGRAPLLWRGTSVSTRRLLAPRPVAHVYLDVSGSMDPALPLLAAALRAPARSGAIRLFTFSTVVDEASPGDIAGQRFVNTRGTDIACVLEHLEQMPRRLRPRRVVLITDGYVGPVDPARLQPLGVALYVGHYAVYGDRSLNDLDAVARHVEPLPALPT
jgi:hypothetical protein